MPTEPTVPTLAEVVHRAVTVCDPKGADEGLEREEILRLAARAEFDGNPPAAVRAWLEAQGAGSSARGR